jgi:hypothetical protein
MIIERRIKMNKFFKIALAIMLLSLILYIVQFSKKEPSDKKAIALNPVQVARQYVITLKNKDYKTAYSYLTPDTQERFSLSDFISMSKSMAGMNENTAEIHWEGVFVGMQIYQDPGSWAYLLVKTNGKWKIVIRKGSSSFPYVKDYFCGNSECEY